MCKTPKVDAAPVAPPPPSVLEQVAPNRTSSAEKAAKGRGEGTKRFRSGKSGLTIGGLKGSSTGVGIGN